MRLTRMRLNRMRLTRMRLTRMKLTRMKLTRMKLTRTRRAPPIPTRQTTLSRPCARPARAWPALHVLSYMTIYAVIYGSHT